MGDAVYRDVAARLETLPVYQNSGFLRNVLERGGYTVSEIDEIAPLFQEFVATPQVAALVKSHLDIPVSGRGLQAADYVANKLKALKLVGTAFPICRLCYSPWPGGALQHHTR